MRAYANPWAKILQGTVRFEVPLYQRPYVWQKREELENDRLGPFWEDVKQTVDALVEWNRLLNDAEGDESRITAMTPHFFGAIVVDRAVKVGQVTTHEVIDGQQRLTTSILLLAAATELCVRTGRHAHASRLRKLWIQDEDLGFTGIDRFKLTPTRADRDAFMRVLDQKPNDADRTTTVSKAFEYFLSELHEWASGLNPDEEHEYFDALRDTLYEQLLIVDIHLDEGDNAQGIFESLNAQGEKLLALDLVKNEMFRRAKRAKLDLDDLENNSWAPEFNSDYWRKPIRQGRYFRPRAELFLMHWLIEQTASEVSATGLYVEFVKLTNLRLGSEADAAEYFAQFFKAARTYRQFDELSEGSIESRFFRRRSWLDVTLPYPLALRLWRKREEGVISIEDLRLALGAVESWLIRRALCGDTPKNYNNVVIQMLRMMDKRESEGVNPVVALVQFMRDASEKTSWWPDDERLRARLTSQRFYHALTPRQLETRILETLESRLMTSKSESLTFDAKLTIEHIIPQGWEEDWPLVSPDEDSLSEDERRIQEEAARRNRESHLHLLGNLTLVTGSLNPAMGNDPWAAKRAALGEHSTLLLNKQLIYGTDTDPPTDGSVFDESRIDARGSILADLILREWPGPDDLCWAIATPEN